MGFFQTLPGATATSDVRALQEASETTKACKQAMVENADWSKKFGNLEAMMESADKASQKMAKATILAMRNTQQLMESTKSMLGEGAISSALGPVAMLTPRVVDIVGM